MAIFLSSVINFYFLNNLLRLALDYSFGGSIFLSLE